MTRAREWIYGGVLEHDSNRVISLFGEVLEIEL
jgi:hypothetical protein